MQDFVFSLVEKRIFEKDNRETPENWCEFQCGDAKYREMDRRKIENTALSFLKESMKKQRSLCSNTKLVVFATIFYSG